MQHVRGFFSSFRTSLNFSAFQKFEFKCCLLIFSCTALLPILGYDSRSSYQTVIISQSPGVCFTGNM